MKKNIIIGVLSAAIIIMALFSILQKSKAEEAMKLVIESEERANVYQKMAEQSKIRADQQARHARVAMEDAIRST